LNARGIARAYVDKKDGKPTGSFVGEWPKGKKKRRFKTMQEAKDYEAFTKLFGREPPTIEDGGASAGELSYREVVVSAKAAGGPKGKWKSERDPSLMQRLEFGVGVIGDLGITRIDRAALTRIRDHASLRASTNATRNRYMMAARAVLSYAENEGLIDRAPKAPMLDETLTRRYRDILAKGQDEIILAKMVELGYEREAKCVDILIQTGLRSGELKKLTPEQVNVEPVEDAQGTNWECGVVRLKVGQTKNNKMRVCIFSPHLAKYLKALVATNSVPNGDRLLDTFKWACEDAGITGNLVIHSLRHTRGTRLRKAGVSDGLRQQMLGHISKEAAEIYNHLDLTDQLEAVKKVQEHAGKSGLWAETDLIKTVENQ
jgi:integrase